MNKAELYLDFYQNNYYNYIQKQIQNNFRNNYQVMRKYIVQQPITERLINTMSIMFKRRPNVQVTNSKLQQFINRSNFYDIIKQANKYVNLLGKVGLMPRIYKQKIIIDIISPDRC